jgi:hypothetical protein
MKTKTRSPITKISQIFGIFYSTLKGMPIFLQKMGRAKFWAIFPQTGDPEGSFSKKGEAPTSRLGVN